MSESVKVPFETWAIVEVKGAQVYAGRVSEQTIAGTGFVRVDVPEIPATRYDFAQPAFTKILRPGSISVLTPCTELVARRAAVNLGMRPFTIADSPERITLVKADLTEGDGDEV